MGLVGEGHSVGRGHGFVQVFAPAVEGVFHGGQEAAGVFEAAGFQGGDCYASEVLPFPVIRQFHFGHEAVGVFQNEAFDIFTAEGIVFFHHLVKPRDEVFPTVDDIGKIFDGQTEVFC